MDRFWSKVNRTGECWIWTGTTRAGYGQFWHEGRHVMAHRLSYEWQNGPIPSGLVIDHLCSNPPCVRPDHLRAVTQRVNVLAGQTIVAAQAGAAECSKGHPYSGDNLRIDKNGHRVCVTCLRENWRKKDERRRHKIARGTA